jgi:hypothetical protein
MRPISESEIFPRGGPRAHYGEIGEGIRRMPSKNRDHRKKEHPQSEPATALVARLVERRVGVIYSAGRGEVLNLAGYVLERALVEHPDWDIFTNLPFAWGVEGSVPKPPHVHQVKALSEILESSARSGLQGREVLWLLGGVDLGETPGEWLAFSKLCGKLGVHGPLLVYGDLKHVPSKLLAGTKPGDYSPSPKSHAEGDRTNQMDVTQELRERKCDVCNARLSTEGTHNFLRHEAEGELASVWSIWQLCESCASEADTGDLSRFCTAS